MQGKPRKKKFRFKLIIYPAFQVRMILINVGLFALFGGVIFFQVHQAFSKLETLGKKANIPEGSSYFKFLEYQESEIFFYAGISAIVICGLSGFLIALYSNKLAGPLVRLRNFFTQIANGGKVDTVSFRKNDYFQEFPDIINRSFERFTGKKEKESGDIKDKAS